MELGEDEVIQILKFVEQSNFDEFLLETGELKLVVRKGGWGTAVTEADSASVSPATARTVSQAPAKQKPEQASPPVSSGTGDTVSESEGCIVLIDCGQS